MNMNVDRFAEYFVAVHGCEPFPWQVRLLRDVVARAAWPRALALPTGAGKTAVLDISLFALACGAGTPRRTAMVVDRRIVVDDAYRRALRIREALVAAHDGVLRELRDALLELGGATPVEAALLRGGIYREDNWARDPLQPVLVCSTVDQVGSRLLHQGYGVSPHTRSVHAGLLGNDCLVVLDEAHASEPFRQTLAWIAKFRAMAARPLAAPFAVVTMTATPLGTDTPFTLNDEDRKHPVLRRRLAAHKLCRTAVAEQPKEAGVAKQLVAETLASLAPGHTVLVVANQVKTARAVAEELDRLRSARKDPLAIEQPVLLTGRSRPLERDRLLAPHRDPAADRLFAGRDRARHAAALPLIVVATQCVEVGADLDADVLITEICPLDALRQRLGRLDRLGARGTSEVVAVAPAEIDQDAWQDPVYGDAPRATWKWLVATAKEHGQPLDLGIDGCEALLADADDAFMRSVVPAPPDAPLLFPAYLDLWVQTSPEPATLPDPAVFLHGPRRGAPEVQIVWRADLPEDQPETWAEIVAECPPVVGETLSVPIHLARQWLTGETKGSSSGADLEGEAADTEVGRRRGREFEVAARPFLRWRGGESSGVSRSVPDLRPGDTIVVPCTFGGCDMWGWAPEKTGVPVSDLADEARFRARRTPVLRLHADMPSALRMVFADVPMEHTDAVLAAIDEQVRAALTGLDPDAIEEDCSRSALAALKFDAEHARTGVEVLPHPSGSGWILRGRHRMAQDGPEFAAEDDAASRLACAVTLEAHASDVKAEAGLLARRLVPALEAEIALAADLHDLGKADPRFQAMLHGGNRYHVSRGELLAKSARMPLSAGERRAARAGYPEGGRHELLSVRLAEDLLRKRGDNVADPELVLHLVAAHHGRCRAFAPVVEDPRPRMVSVSWHGIDASAASDGKVNGTGLEHVAGGVPERFWRLIRRYGWWGLSYLEACLRLADWRASAREESNHVTKNGGAA